MDNEWWTGSRYFVGMFFFFFFLSYFTNDYLLIGTIYHPLPPPTTPHERATKQMKMAQKTVYRHLGHRYPFFFSLLILILTLFFLVTLLQITMCGCHITLAGHHYHYDGTGMDCMMMLAPTQDLFSKLVITFVWHLCEHAFLFNLIFFFPFFSFLLSSQAFLMTWYFFLFFSRFHLLSHTFYLSKKVSYENRSVIK